MCTDTKSSVNKNACMYQLSVSIWDSSGLLQKVFPVDLLFPHVSEGGSLFPAVTVAVSAHGLSSSYSNINKKCNTNHVLSTR